MAWVLNNRILRIQAFIFAGGPALRDAVQVRFKDPGDMEAVPDSVVEILGTEIDEGMREFAFAFTAQGNNNYRWSGKIHVFMDVADVESLFVDRLEHFENGQWVPSDVQCQLGAGFVPVPAPAG